MALLKYRVWCLTDNQWEYVWQEDTDPVPTTCPVDAGHTIDTSNARTSVVERKETNFFAEINDVKDKDLATPPGSPSDGDRYIIANAATGDWSGLAQKLTQYNQEDSVWNIVSPRTGKVVYVEDESEYYRFDGTNWVIFRAQGGVGVFTAGDFAEVTTLAQKSGTSWGTLLTMTKTPQNANSKFLVQFNASMGMSVNPERHIDFRLVAGSATPTERRGTYATSDKTTQVANAALIHQLDADDGAEHTFQIEWRVRSGDGTVSIDPVNNIYEHAGMIVKEIQG